MIVVLAQAAAPTARSIRWLPYIVLCVGLLAVALLAGSADGPVDAVLAVATAGLASAVVAGLHDPAADLLTAVPVSEMRRRALRLSLLGAPGLAVWWGVTALADGSAAVGPVVALTVSGVAVAVWVPVRRSVRCGAGAPLAWLLLDRLAAGSGVLGDVAGWWRTDPWPVVAVALLMCVARSRR